MAKGLKLPVLIKNPFYLGNFSEIAIGKLSNFYDCSPDLLDFPARKFTVFLNLSSSHAHDEVY